VQPWAGPSLEPWAGPDVKGAGFHYWSGACQEGEGDTWDQALAGDSDVQVLMQSVCINQLGAAIVKIPVAKLLFSLILKMAKIDKFQATDLSLSIVLVRPQDRQQVTPPLVQPSVQCGA
jgi:hypothetical protein